MILINVDEFFMAEVKKTIIDEKTFFIKRSPDELFLSKLQEQAEAINERVNKIFRSLPETPEKNYQTIADKLINKASLIEYETPEGQKVLFSNLPYLLDAIRNDSVNEPEFNPAYYEFVKKYTSLFDELINNGSNYTSKEFRNSWGKDRKLRSLDHADFQRLEENFLNICSENKDILELYGISNAEEIYNLSTDKLILLLNHLLCEIAEYNKPADRDKKDSQPLDQMLKKGMKDIVCAHFSVLLSFIFETIKRSSKNKDKKHQNTFILLVDHDEINHSYNCIVHVKPDGSLLSAAIDPTWLNSTYDEYRKSSQDRMKPKDIVENLDYSYERNYHLLTKKNRQIFPSSLGLPKEFDETDTEKIKINDPIINDFHHAIKVMMYPERFSPQQIQTAEEYKKLVELIWSSPLLYKKKKIEYLAFKSILFEANPEFRNLTPREQQKIKHLNSLIFERAINNYQNTEEKKEEEAEKSDKLTLEMGRLYRMFLGEGGNYSDLLSLEKFNRSVWKVGELDNPEKYINKLLSLQSAILERFEKTLEQGIINNKFEGSSAEEISLTLQATKEHLEGAFAPLSTFNFADSPFNSSRSVFGRMLMILAQGSENYKRLCQNTSELLPKTATLILKYQELYNRLIRAYNDYADSHSEEDIKKQRESAGLELRDLSSLCKNLNRSYYTQTITLMKILSDIFCDMQRTDSSEVAIDNEDLLKRLKKEIDRRVKQFYEEINSFQELAGEFQELSEKIKEKDQLMEFLDGLVEISRKHCKPSRYSDWELIELFKIMTTLLFANTASEALNRYRFRSNIKESNAFKKVVGIFDKLSLGKEEQKKLMDLIYLRFELEQKEVEVRQSRQRIQEIIKNELG
ncbi:MAG: hypothetical protein Kow0081_5050 [Candidatus Dojkabacteria bacterium]